MESGTKKIIKHLKFYNCGYCTNELSHMYKNVQKEKVDFHARVMLIEHETHGYILVDTGYSQRIFENGIMSKLYHQLNPTKVDENQSIVNQLKSDNIEIENIKTIILTHLHPDHIGGVYDFPHASLIMSKESQELIKNAKVKDLVFKNQISDKVNHQIIAKSLNQDSPLEEFKGIDLLGDQSIWLLSLEGHAYGQLGVFLPEEKLFYVADAIWGSEYLDFDMRFIPKQVQFNYESYMKTISKLKKLHDIQIISTHGNEAYLNEQ